MQREIQKKVLIVGNPNVGKSTIFNLLCNKKQKTGNYAGVTVASYSGTYDYNNETVEVIDLPGSYSIYPSSEDEAIFSKYLVEEQANYVGVIYIVEALSVKRGLLLFQQIQDLGIPVLLVLNQIDQAEKRGIHINVEELSKSLGTTILVTNAKENKGIEAIREAVHQNRFSTADQISFEIPVEQKGLVMKILGNTKQSNQYKIWTLLASEKYLGKLETVEGSQQLAVAAESKGRDCAPATLELGHLLHVPLACQGAEPNFGVFGAICDVLSVWGARDRSG